MCFVLNDSVLLFKKHTTHPQICEDITYLEIWSTLCNRTTVMMNSSATVYVAYKIIILDVLTVKHLIYSYL